MIIRLIKQIIVIAIVALAAACTSTNAPTANTNPNYANQYNQGTRSTQVTQNKEDDKKPVEIDQTVTLMQMSFEVGEINPGQSYVLYAKVDNPSNRGLRYQWRATSGSLENAPDEDQSRLIAMLEGKAVDKTTGGTGISSDSTTPVNEINKPGLKPTDTTTKQEKPETSKVRSSSSTDEESISDNEKEPARVRKTIKAESDKETSTVETDEKTAIDDESTQTKSDKTANTTDEEPKPIRRPSNSAIKKNSGNKQTTKDDAKPKSFYKSFDDDENNQTKDKAKPKGDKVNKDDLKPGKRQIPAGVAGRAGEAIGKAMTERVQTRAGSLDSQRIGSSDESLEANADENAPGYKEADEEGKASGRAMEFRTSIPVVRWNAAGLGKVTIKLLIVDDKGQEVAGPREMEFEVTTPKPTLSIDFDKAQELTEDAFITVNLKGSNLVDFRKALATLSFSQDILSFRYAKIGSFFPNASQTNFFYAQPDPKSGTITAAFSFDDETRMADGDGVIASFTFKLRKNVEKPEDINFSLTPGPTNVYILDSTGTDTLTPIDFKPTIIANNLVEPKNKAVATDTAATTTTTEPSKEGQTAVPTTTTPQTTTTTTGTTTTTTTNPNTPPTGTNTQAPPSTVTSPGGTTSNPVNLKTIPTPSSTLPTTAQQIGPGLWLDSTTQFYYALNPSSNQYIPFTNVDEAQRAKIEFDRRATK